MEVNAGLASGGYLEHWLPVPRLKKQRCREEKVHGRNAGESSILDKDSQTPRWTHRLHVTTYLQSALTVADVPRREMAAMLSATASLHSPIMQWDGYEPSVHGSTQHTCGTGVAEGLQWQR